MLFEDVSGVSRYLKGEQDKRNEDAKNKHSTITFFSVFQKSNDRPTPVVGLKTNEIMDNLVSIDPSTATVNEENSARSFS